MTVQQVTIVIRCSLFSQKLRRQYHRISNADATEYLSCFRHPETHYLYRITGT
ncbi:MAG TPA: hypothetical protein PLU53_13710 [Bacteroidia bacterium]|nr:hypothetical protein [Bacteroidia bacterium]